MTNELPCVDIIEEPNTFVSGAAIRLPGSPPTFVIPFPRRTLKAALLINEHECLLIAETMHPTILVAKVDSRSGTVLQNTMLNAWGQLLLSQDRKTLYVAGRGISAIDVATLTVRHDYNLIFMSDDHGRLSNTADYFTLDSTIKDRGSRVFHSTELEAEYHSAGTARILMPSGPAEEIENGRLRVALRERDIQVDANHPDGFSIKEIHTLVEVELPNATISHCPKTVRQPAMPPRQKPLTDPATNAAFSAFVRQETFIHIDVDAWTSTACALALKNQEARIAAEFESLLSGGHHISFLNFDYRVASECLSEEIFFQRILKSEFEIIAPLRSLISTYLKKVTAENHPWQAGAGPALCSAMRTLALSDPKSVDLLRLYLIKRDMEHENYCYTRIILEFGDRHGWETDHALRLGLFVILRNEPIGNDLRGRIFDAAEKRLNIEHFIKVLIEEIEMQAHSITDLDLTSEIHIFCNYLDINTPFQQRLHAALQPYIDR